MIDQDVRRGAGIYSKPVLRFYDLLVVQLSNSLAWRCPSRRMLEQYDLHMGRRHLDVGPGTGWYLANASLPENAEIMLMDLNTNTMESTASRLGSAANTPRGVVANVLDPIPGTMGEFDSIGINYVLHCVPGSWESKGRAFAHLADALSEDGTLFGGTILGDAAGHNLFGRGLMALYNRMGIFHNRDDDASGLRAALERSFHSVSIEVVGTVAVFTAQRPRR